MKAPIQGHESREFNRMYKEVDELYNEVALKSGLSDTNFISCFVFHCGIGRRLSANRYREPIFYQQANDQLISQSLRTKRLSLFKAWEKA